MSSQPAGYSRVPLTRKLGIRPGVRLGLLGAPDGLQQTLGPLPDGVVVRRSAQGPLDLIVAFFVERAALERVFWTLCTAIDPAGGVWIAWPKRGSGMSTDLFEDAVREIGLAAGLVDNKVCAIDQVWSALRFVYRVADRPRR